MKKIILIGIIALALVGMTGLSTASTTYDTTWDGSGYLDIDFQSGDDARSRFWTSGTGIKGEYHAIDHDNNAYSYGVDTTSVRTKAEVKNGGYIEHLFERKDSHEGMYGAAGQSTYSYLNSDNTASFAIDTNTNFARLRTSNYGWKNTNQFTANGNHVMTHQVNNGDGLLNAGWWIEAIGQTTVSHSAEEIGHKNRLKFGWGDGCTQRAKVDITGSGMYDLIANAPNKIETKEIGITTDGALEISATFGSGFHFGNYALSGN